jgi:CDP-glycerol glycerophosphotransferase
MNKNRLRDILYLGYRLLGGTANRIAFILCGLLPVKKDRIVFCSIEGQSGYSCNPRYIGEELIRKKCTYRLYWLLNDMSKEIPEGITKIKNSFWNRAYFLSTAKVWIDNSRKPLGTRKRHSQLYLQTWHATLAFKPAGKARTNFPLIANWISKADSLMADYVFTDSQWCDERYETLLFTHGNTLRIGSPRCDIFFRDRQSIAKTLREYLSIPIDAKIIVYAPTFRGGNQKGIRRIAKEEYNLDWEQIREQLTRKFDGQWYICIRQHPQLAALQILGEQNKEKRIYDISQMDDMNMILVGADAFITDYSSAAFDACIGGLPVFLLMEDVETFTKERGNLSWKLGEIPFPVAKDMAELLRNIAAFSTEDYLQKRNFLFYQVKLVADGKACNRAVSIIDEFIQSGEINGRKYEQKQLAYMSYGNEGRE